MSPTYQAPYTSALKMHSKEHTQTRNIFFHLTLLRLSQCMLKISLGKCHSALGICGLFQMSFELLMSNIIPQ